MQITSNNTNKVSALKEQWGVLRSYVCFRLNKICKSNRATTKVFPYKRNRIKMVSMVTAIPPEELRKRERRKNSYHLVSSNNRLPDDCDDTDFLFRYLMNIPGQSTKLQEAKTKLLRELGHSNGDTSAPGFQAALEDFLSVNDINEPPDVSKRCKPKEASSRRVRRPEKQDVKLEGMWIDLAKPRFTDNLGVNKDGTFMYSLGRMSFDMYQPSDLICSVKGAFNPMHFLKSKERNAIIEKVPKDLRSELKEEDYKLMRSYNTVTAITIEPGSSEFDEDSPNHEVDKPIEGLMTTHGYAIPNAEQPNRLSIFWTGGSIEVADPEDLSRWRNVFEKKRKPKKQHKQPEVISPRSPPHSSPSSIRSSTTKKRRSRFKYVRKWGTTTAPPRPPPLPLKMEKDGRISYELNYDAVASVDILYLDETIRIAKAHSGTIYVFARVPHFPDE